MYLARWLLLWYLIVELSNTKKGEFKSLQYCLFSQIHRIYTCVNIHV